MSDDLLNRAMELHQSGKLDEAESLYQQMLAARPNDADLLHLLGMVALQRGQVDEAIRSFSAAIAANGKQAIFHANLGEALRASGRLAEAKASYQAALALAPGLEVALNNLGLVQLGLEEFADARRTFQQLAQSHPANAQAQFNLGNACQAAKYREEAIAAYNQAITLAPQMVAAYHQLGMVLQEQRRYADAIKCHQRAVELDPNAAASIGALGVSLHLSGKLREAEAEYRRYLEFAPRDALAHLNLATVLHMTRQLAEAEVEYRRAAEFGTAGLPLYLKLGECLHVQGKLAAAADAFRQAINLDPTVPEPHFHLGAVLLSQGDFVAGWPELEWRLARVARDYAQPIWDGGKLEGKRIVVYAERGGGLGDTLQFVRYEPLIRQRGGEVVFEVQPQLIPILQQSGYRNVVPIEQPAILTAQARELRKVLGEKISPPCDFQATLLSLPRIFDTNLESIPATVPYLSADPKLVDDWATRLADLKGFKVGIHWHGSQVAIQQHRVIPLAEFEPLARVPGVTLISLQKDQGREQIAEVAARFTVVDFGDELDNEHGPFMDTAAIMKNLDLVITTDTVTAHLAGALGVPVWVVLPLAGEWRWLIDRDDSPWYPTMRLFRQTRLDDWSGALARVADELKALASQRGRS